MATISQINTYSQTALAAYATNLTIGNEDNTANYKDTRVGMADAQATQFNSEWAVLEQSAPDPVTGFSAVLLQRKDAASNPTGEKVLAIAGTDHPADLLSDLGIFLGTSVTDILQYNALEAFYTKLTQSGGKLGSGEQFTITGHSLGGFLAQAFTARHASVVSAAYTFNAPGLGAIDNPLGYLGASNAGAGAEKITNVHATDGLSVTAGFGFMLGSTLPVRIENNGNTDNHSIVRLSDTLAIYETYARLMPDISTAQASALFAASGSSSRRQEDALDALRTVFTGSASNDANKTPTDNHDAFGANLYQLQNSATFKSLQGQALIRASGADLQANARNNFGALVALQELSPIYLVGKDAAAQSVLDAVLQSTRADDYTAWAADKSTSTPTTFTDQWIADRAALLQAIVIRNQKDETANTLATDSAPADRNLQFQWYGANPLPGETLPGLATLLETKPYYADRPVQKIAFGDEGANALIGTDSTLGDHLYGGAGADTLDGKGGNDYLEGGFGGDTYQFTGTFGKDTVLDSDGHGLITVDGVTLTGGKKLDDGTWVSDDKQWRYVLTERDELIIGNGSGTSGITIKGWSTMGGNQLGIILDGAPASTTPAEGALFYNGDQRAKLIGTETQLGVSADHSTYGTYAWGETSWANDGTLINGKAAPDFNDVIYATAAGANGSVMHGWGGSDALSGSAGVDDIFGGEGHDLIGGGAGSDNKFVIDGQGNLVVDGDGVVGSTIFGSAQRDQINDGIGNDAVSGGADNDLIGGIRSKTRVRIITSEWHACINKSSVLPNRYKGYGLISYVRRQRSPGCASRLAVSSPRAVETAVQL